MALSKDEIAKSYPLPSYNYKVDIGGIDVAFSQVSGITKQFETTTYKESSVGGSAPGPVTMRMPAQSSDVTVTLQKGVVPAVSIPALYEWINSIKANQVDKKDITISLMDAEGNPVIGWKVINAFPTQLEAPTFDASSNDAAVESLQLMADNVEIFQP